jgi:hypothetical protein
MSNCIIENCEEKAIYGLNDDTSKKSWCKEHKPSEALLIRSGYCGYDDCEKRACYNFKGKKKEIFCLTCVIKHKLINVVNVKHQFCIYKNCDKRATKRLNENEKILYCLTCYNFIKNNNVFIEDKNIENKHIEIKNNILDKDDNIYETKNKFECSNIINSIKCNNEGIYIHQNDISKKYCKFCKTDDMYIYNSSKFCIGQNDEGCPYKTRPAFNYDGLNPLYCGQCKKEGMIDVKHDLCTNLIDNIRCTKRGLFNFPGETKPLYCGSCAKSKHGNEMIDIIVKRCEGILENGEKCMKQPSHNYPNIRTPKYCAKCAHKESTEMIDVITKRCCGILEDGSKCTTFATFNFPENTEGLYCFNCSLEGMIAVKFKKCIECIRLKELDDNHKIGRAHFNFISEKNGLYCRTCKLDEMVNVTYNRCKQDGCEILACTKKYEGYCSRCYFFNNPDKPLTKCYRAKEIEVANFVKSNFNNFEISLNKSVGTGCSRKRPDIFFDLGTYCLVIEVDENQHIDYGCSCETKRLVSIFDDVGERNLIFIRFNPDSYIDSNNKLIKSPWNKNSLGLTCVPKAKISDWNNRLQILKDTIQYWLDNRPEKLIEVVQLFYDQNF